MRISKISFSAFFIARSTFLTKEHPELLVFLETLKTATSPQAHPRWIDIQEIFTEQLERVLFGKKVDRAMKKAEKEILEILNEEL